jgi:hypothetical protein
MRGAVIMSFVRTHFGLSGNGGDRGATDRFEIAQGKP